MVHPTVVVHVTVVHAAVGERCSLRWSMIGQVASVTSVPGG